MPIIGSSRRQRRLPHRPSHSRVAAGWKLSADRMDECRTEGCCRELPMMGIMVPETC